MGERAVLALAKHLEQGLDIHDLRGICTIQKEIIKDSETIELPSYEIVRNDKNAFISMFDTFYHNNDARTAKG